MEAVVERDALTVAAARAQNVAERKNAIPILSNLLLEAEDGFLRLTATDLDIEIVETIEAKIASKGAVTVSAHMLHEIVRKIPTGAELQLTCDSENGQLQLKAADSYFSLNTLPREDFPLMAQSDYDAQFSVSATYLRRLFDSVFFAISEEETRYYLNGTYLHIVGTDNDSGFLRVVATDGHRLAHIDAPAPEGAKNAPGVIVPRKTVGELKRLLEKDDTEVNVSVSETKIKFQTESFALTSKVIDGTFPDYNRVIPQNNKIELKLPAQPLAAAIDRVATLASERTSGVKFDLSEKGLTLSVDNPMVGTASEHINTDYQGAPSQTGFSARYLSDILQQVGDTTITFRFSEEWGPTLIQSADDEQVLYVLMPMKV